MIDFVEPKSVDWAHVTSLLERSKAANRWTNGGPVVALLEEELKQWLRTRQPVVACTNGSAALFALVEMHNLLAGRALKWAVSSFGFACSRQGPLRDAVIVDCDRHALLDFDQIPADCDGVVFTNVFGIVKDTTPIRHRVEAMGKIFICDSAGAFDCCTHGPNEIISLHHTKPWGFGEGGCAIVAAEHEALFRSLIAFGSNTAERSHASNGKMSDVAAAFVLQWLAGCPERIAVHQEQYARLAGEGMRRGFAPLSGDGTFPVGLPQNLPMLAPAPVANPPGVQKYYRPLAATPVATDLFARVINLPCHGGVRKLTAIEAFFPDFESSASAPVRLTPMQTAILSKGAMA